ncbi:MAG: hypothetical protein J3K34DRAFT_412263 [Monoraphidium minutum]|nr:MAG: hypothetical protein J3K34DRAFT_412263 [Monoraphidium minutum]
MTRLSVVYGPHTRFTCAASCRWKPGSRPAAESWPAKSTSTSIVQPTCACERVSLRASGHWWMWSSRTKLACASLLAVPLALIAGPSRRRAPMTQPRMVSESWNSSAVAVRKTRHSAVDASASASGCLFSSRLPWCVRWTHGGIRMCAAAQHRPTPAAATANAEGQTLPGAESRIQAAVPSTRQQKNASKNRVMRRVVDRLGCLIVSTSLAPLSPACGRGERPL